jgi:hypothetical protein
MTSARRWPGGPAPIDRNRRLVTPELPPMPGAAAGRLPERSDRDRRNRPAPRRTSAIEQPSKFELVINLKMAKALRITIPKDMLLRADEVVQ